MFPVLLGICGRTSTTLNSGVTLLAGLGADVLGLGPAAGAHARVVVEDFVEGAAGLPQVPPPGPAQGVVAADDRDPGDRDLVVAILGGRRAQERAAEVHKEGVAEAVVLLELLELFLDAVGVVLEL